jgi:N-acyl-D-amino-acid deacylase
MASEATEEEVVALCRRLVPTRGLHVTHLRNEGAGLLASVAEALRIGRVAGVGTVFSHHKVIGAAMHGATAESLVLIDEAAVAQEVALDVYPYAYSSTSLTLERAMRGGRVTITRSGQMPEMVGRELADIAVELGCDLSEAVTRLVPAGALYHVMHEDDVVRVLRHPRCMIGSDGLPFDPHPHPRLTGSFPRVLGHYVRDRAVLALPEAIRRMTSLPAEVFGLHGRGRIAKGYIADLVLFDPCAVADHATPANPWAEPTGIRRVLVGGRDATTGAGIQLTSHRK